MSGNKDMKQKALKFAEGQLAAIDKYLDEKVFKVYAQAAQIKSKIPPPLKPSSVLVIIVSLFVLTVLYLSGFNAMTNLVGFVYPLFASYKAIESANKDDDTQWLTYWVIYSLFSLIESFTDILFDWIPFYPLFKGAFLVWCFLPNTQGAQFVYNTFVKHAFKKAEKNAKKIVTEIKDDMDDGEVNPGGKED